MRADEREKPLDYQLRQKQGRPQQAAALGSPACFPARGDEFIEARLGVKLP